jgi:hypothetical protein
MTTDDNKKLAKTSTDFCCKLCDYSTSKKYNYELHCQTKKHKNALLTTNDNEKLAKTSAIINITCDKCEKQFNDRAGLWRHKKKCITEKKSDMNESNNDTKLNDNNLIMLLINDNKELRNLLIEQCKDKDELKNMVIEQQNIMMKVLENGTNNTIHTNSHNKAFNLNFFLNETCKDAMNIMDFVESIQLQLSDLERVGEVGYIEGISNIIVKNLKALDVTQRPVHCTDKKRETLYVKDDNKWEKDDDNIKMHKMIRKVQDKNFRMIKKFKEKYPDYHKPTSKQSDVYNNIIIESMGGRGDNDYEKEEKIIKKVSKEIVVEK